MENGFCTKRRRAKRKGNVRFLLGEGGGGRVRRDEEDVAEEEEEEEVVEEGETRRGSLLAGEEEEEEGSVGGREGRFGITVLPSPPRSIAQKQPRKEGDERENSEKRSIPQFHSPLPSLFPLAAMEARKDKEERGKKRMAGSESRRTMISASGHAISYQQTSVLKQLGSGRKVL